MIGINTSIITTVVDHLYDFKINTLFKGTVKGNHKINTHKKIVQEMYSQCFSFQMILMQDNHSVTTRSPIGFSMDANTYNMESLDHDIKYEAV